MEKARPHLRENARIAALALVAALVAMALVALAGCASTAGTSGNATVTTPPPTTQPSGTATKIASTGCAASQLTIVPAGSSVGAGNVGAMYRLENHSAESCTVAGFPAVQLLNSQHGAMTTHARNATSGYFYRAHPEHLVRLARGMSAYFVMEWTQVPGNGQTCPMASYVRVTPPTGSGMMVTASSVDACGGSVTVSPVAATAFSGFAPGPTAPTLTPTHTPTPTHTATPTPTPPPTLPLMPTPTTTPKLPLIMSCRASNFTLAQAANDAGAGHVGLLYSLTNGGSDACAMTGYPTVRLLDADHQPMPTHQHNATRGYFYSDQQVRQVSVQSQGSAYFALEWTHVPSSGQTCPTAAVAEVTPPGAHVSLYAPGAIDACGGNITVSPVQGATFRI